jgi:hypothetical protein
MRRTFASKLTTRLLEVGLGVGLILSIAGCAREDAAGQAQGSTEPQASAPAAPPLPSPRPAEPASQDREQFRQALARKFDSSQIVMRQGSPEAGVLHIPNGHVAHAVVAVKNADGTVTQHCLSSSAEVEALMKQTGAGQ